MKTILHVYDFDDTLIKSPQPTSALIIKKFHAVHNKVHNNRFKMEPSLVDIENDFMKWWDNPISLNPNYFNFATNIPVLEHYNSGKNNPAVLNVLISHRISQLRIYIEDILETFGYYMDHYYFGGRTQTSKSDMLNRILKQYPDIKHVEFHEDEILHLHEYEQTLYEHVNPYTYKLFLVNAKSTLRLQTTNFLNGFEAKDNLLKF